MPTAFDLVPIICSCRDPPCATVSIQPFSAAQKDRAACKPPLLKEQHDLSKPI